MKNKVTHWSFWIISIFILLWNAMGCINFAMQMNPKMVASYGELEQAMILGRPLWASITFFISVSGGALACILLLLRNTLAFYVSAVSLVATLITIAHSLTTGITFSIGEIVAIVLMPVVLSAFLVWYSHYSHGKGWL